MEPEIFRHERLQADAVSKAVGIWIVECLALPYLGMPKGAYTIILDGDPTPERSSEVFSVVQRDAAWQTALDLSSRNGLTRPSWFERRLRIGYIYECLPQGLQEIYESQGDDEGHSLIRCNFNLHVPYATEKVLNEQQGQTSQGWDEAWARHEPSEFQTAPPLPPWHLLRWHRVLPW